ncbi:SCO6745 family protein [Amycolatopsis sp. cmx-4-68]|uniref:SCO6745 family protein n=1 Tax=Amycolatopsis sp. cmx-4-68 TaxID=2790938 RepID=UPI00397A1CEE
MSTSPARRLWAVVEPLHAVVYFAPETASAAKEAGLRGYWMGYFAGRLAPLGPIGPAPAGSVLFAFAPAMVARALPDAWSFASPPDVLRTRLAAVEAALERVLGPSGHEELASLLERAVAACGFEGRPLAAAWAAVPRPAGALGRLWLATTVLREHRGDGHVLAAVHAGLGGLETTLTHIGDGVIGRGDVEPHRGWSDDEWTAAVDGLRSRGLLGADGRLTSAGAELRRRIEDDTDRLAAAPAEALGPELDRVLELAVPLARAVIDAGVVPVPNPMGVARP